MADEETEVTPEKRIVEAVASMAGSGVFGRPSLAATEITKAMAIGVQMCLDAGLGVSRHPDTLREAQMVGKLVALNRMTAEEGIAKVTELIAAAKAKEADEAAQG